MTELNGSSISTQGKPKLTALDQVRLKNAAEAHRVHKSIYLDPVTGEPQEGFQPWPQFRDEFLADWKANRRVVTESEADMHFDRIAEESLSELDTTGAPTDVNQVLDQVTQTESEVESTETSAPAVSAASDATQPAASTSKRRGRPAGKASSATKPTHVAKKSSKAAHAVARKAAAKKKGSGKSTSERAQHIIEVYQAKKWARKDILEKLTAQIEGLGVAYASTLYQKFAK